jgi:hypothetical protein
LDKRRVLRFVVSIILIGLITFILHIPDIKEPGGIERIVGRTSKSLGENLELFVNLIFQAFSWETQSWSPSMVFAILIYFFFIVGIMASMKKFKNQIILIFLYITIPVIVLLSVRPLNTTIRNAPDRYLIFFLPLFFFLISKGVSAFWSFIVNSQVRIFKGKISSDIRSRYVSIGVFITFLIFAGFLIPQLKEIYHYRQNLPDSRGALRYINKYIKNDDIVFLEGSFLDFFNQANVGRILPIYVDNYKEKNIIVINKYNFLKVLKGIMNQERQVWGVVYISEKDSTEKKLDAVDTETFRKISVIRFDRDTLVENLKKLLETFLILRENDREDYHLLLTQIYLLEKDINKAKQVIQILKKIDSFDLINKKKLTLQKKSVTLRKTANIYKKIYNDLFVLGEYKESFISFIRYTTFVKSTNRIDAAIRDIRKLIAHRINTEDKEWLVAQFLNLLPFREGIYFIWQDPDGWHIRWGGKNGTRFYGKIVSSLKISSFKKYQFKEKDHYDYSNHFIKFNSTSFNEEICGLDFQVSNRTELKFDLSINEKRIPKEVVIAGALGVPKIIPFYYENSEWK